MYDSDYNTKLFPATGLWLVIEDNLKATVDDVWDDSYILSLFWMHVGIELPHQNHACKSIKLKLT